MSNSFVQLPPDSTGKQIATDAAGGKEYQVIKLAFGSDGLATPVDAEDGFRLPVSTRPSLYDPVTGSIAANGQTISVEVGRASNLMAHCWGTFSTINCAFEGSLNSTDGSDGNWFSIQAVRTDANSISTTTGNLSAAPAYGWELSVNGLKWFRVRATAFTSGTQNWIFLAAPYATEPIPAVQTSTQYVIPTGSTSYGASTHHHLISAAATNATSAKASAGTITSLTLSNAAASPRYFKLYNKASAPVVGTDTPVKTIMIPAGQTVDVDMGFAGLRLTSGIAYALTTGMAVADTGAVGAAEVAVNISYY